MNLSTAQIIGVLLAGIIVIFVIDFSMAFCINWSLERFNANWTDFWGWAVLIATAPVLRAWIIGK